MYYLKVILMLTFMLFTEREKSKRVVESPVEPISSCRDEHGYVPTVGRWGSEWPSWLEEPAKTNKVWRQPAGQARGPWIKGAPLPLPVWGHYESPTLTVDTVEQYEELATKVELQTRRLIQELRYDTVDNFLRSVFFNLKIFLKWLMCMISHLPTHMLFL